MLTGKNVCLFVKQMWHRDKRRHDAVQPRFQGSPGFAFPQREHQHGQEVRVRHPAHLQGSVRLCQACAVQRRYRGHDVEAGGAYPVISFAFSWPGGGAGLRGLSAESFAAGEASETAGGAAVHAVLRGGDRRCLLPLRTHGLLSELCCTAAGEITCMSL